MNWWTGLVTCVVGMVVGALVLNQVIRYRHGKNYSRWIKEDFDLQWQIIRDMTLKHHFSPFSEPIQRVSSQFCTLYGEAEVAEKAKLNAVAGLAYGKSLEILIKDYAKSENPGRDAEIEEEPLARRVKEHVHDDLVKNSAELGAWLRNDQMHYVRRHAEQGVPELKLLIKLIVTPLEEGERRKTFAANVSSLRQAMTATPKSTG